MGDETKFTPGPWRADDHFSCHSVIYAGSQVIAETECAHERQAIHSANARLIAAAPELYALLKEVSDAYQESWEIDAGQTTEHALVTKAREVLAKVQIPLATAA